MGEFARVLGRSTRKVGDMVLSPLTQNMKAAYENWLEERALSRVEAKRGRLSDSAWAELYETTVELIDGGGFSWGTRVSRTSLRTPEGSDVLLLLLLQPSQPEITLEATRAFFDAHTKEVNDAVRYLVSSDPNSSPPEEVTEETATQE